MKQDRFYELRYFKVGELEQKFEYSFVSLKIFCIKNYDFSLSKPMYEFLVIFVIWKTEYELFKYSV